MSALAAAKTALPTHIAEWAGVILPPWNGSDGSWLVDAGGRLCVDGGNATDAVGGVTTSDSVYVRRRVVINVYVVVALCAFGFVGNALTVAVLRRDKVRTTTVGLCLLLRVHYVDLFGDVANGRFQGCGRVVLHRIRTIRVYQ